MENNNNIRVYALDYLYLSMLIAILVLAALGSCTKCDADIEAFVLEKTECQKLTSPLSRDIEYSSLKGYIYIYKKDGILYHKDVLGRTISPSIVIDTDDLDTLYYDRSFNVGSIEILVDHPYCTKIDSTCFTTIKTFIGQDTIQTIFYN